MATHTTTFIVRQHTPWRAVLAAVVLLAAYVGTSWWLYKYAQQQAGFDRQAAASERVQLTDRIEGLQAENDRLTARLAVLERAGQIDRESQLKVRDGLKELQDENLELKQELAFYRGIVSPEDGKAGLKIRALQLKPSTIPGAYRYKLILTQLLENDRYAQGRVKMRLVGRLDGEEQTLDLKALSVGGVAELQFSFKYFQNLEGEIRLPEGFEPTAMTVAVQPRGKGVKLLERRFPWSMEAL